jgi:hypothetical protein
MSFTYSRHSMIAAILLCIAISAGVIIMSVYRMNEGKEQIQVDRRAWNSFDISTLSTSRFGYGSLYSAINDTYGAYIHHLPWSPDRNPEDSSLSAESFFAIINAPERKWNDTEAKELAAFVSRGAVLLLVTPSQEYLDNTASLFTQIGKSYSASRSRKNNSLSSFTSEPQPVRKENSLANPSFRANLYLRLSPSRKNAIFGSGGFTAILKDADGYPVLLQLKRPGWKGKIFWLNAVLPGFNGEKADIVFPESLSKKIISRFNIDRKINDKLNEKYREQIDFDGNLAADRILGQGNSAYIFSGLSFIDSFLFYAGESKRTIVFDDYLRERETGSDILALFSSGAFYAVILAAALVFIGLIFFVRGRAPIRLLREGRNRLQHRYPVNELDPLIMRQTKTRFVAQYIQLSHMLKKIRG